MKNIYLKIIGLLIFITLLHRYAPTPLKYPKTEKSSNVIDIYHGKSIEDEYPKGLSELIIAKHRNGPIGNVNLVVQDQFARFMSANRQ